MSAGMKHNLRASTHGPPDGFWVAPAFVTDYYTEGQRSDAKNTTLSPKGRIHAFFRRVDLPLVLPPCDCPIGIEYACSNLQASLGDALSTEDDRNPGIAGRLGYLSQRSFEEYGIGRGNRGLRPSITRNEAFWKADNHCAVTARLGDRRCRQVHGLLRRSWLTNIGESDANGSHDCLTPRSSRLTLHLFAQRGVIGSCPEVRLWEITPVKRRSGERRSHNRSIWIRCWRGFGLRPRESPRAAS